MSEVILKAINEEISKHEAEIQRLRHMKRIAKGSPLGTTLSNEDVYNYVTKNPGSTVNAIAGALGCSYSQAADAVHVLVRKRKLAQTNKGAKRFQRFEVAPEPQRKADPEKVKELQTKEKPKVQSAPKPKPKGGRKGGGRITAAETNARNARINNWLEHNPGLHPASKVAEGTRLSTPYVKRVLENMLIMGKLISQQGHVTNATGGRVPAKLYGAKPSERETRIHPGGSVEEGRKRSAPITGLGSIVHRDLG